MDRPDAGRAEDDRLIDPGGERHSDIDMLSCADCDEVGDDADDRRCGCRVQEPSYRARERDRAARCIDASDALKRLAEAAQLLREAHSKSAKKPPPLHVRRSRGDPGHGQVDERAAAGDERPERAGGGGTAGDPGGGGGPGAAEGVGGQVQRHADADTSAALHPRQSAPREDDTADGRFDLPGHDGLHAVLPDRAARGVPPDGGTPGREVEGKTVLYDFLRWHGFHLDLAHFLDTLFLFPLLSVSIIVKFSTEQSETLAIFFRLS